MLLIAATGVVTAGSKARDRMVRMRGAPRQIRMHTAQIATASSASTAVWIRARNRLSPTSRAVEKWKTAKTIAREMRREPFSAISPAAIKALAGQKAATPRTVRVRYSLNTMLATTATDRPSSRAV